MSHWQIYVIFRSIKHFFLLDQGDFIVQFMDMAEDEMKKTMDDILDITTHYMVLCWVNTHILVNNQPHFF